MNLDKLEELAQAIEKVFALGECEYIEPSTLRQILREEFELYAKENQQTNQKENQSRRR